MDSSLKKMKILSFVWGLSLFLLVTLLTIFGFLYKNKTQKYKDFEILLEEKAKDYVEKKGLVETENLKIFATELVEENYIENLNVEDTSCDGYVVKNMSTFKAYIKCNHYKTKGYEK